MVGDTLEEARQVRICYIADARSPIAQNWIKFFVERGDEVHVISTYPVVPGAIPGARVHLSLLGLSGLWNRAEASSAPTQTYALSRKPFRFSLLVNSPTRLALRIARNRNWQQVFRAWFVPLELRLHAKYARRIIEQIRPDLVHAMRIPYEGMLAAISVPEDVPLIVSIWGNDFTLYADRYPLVGWRTRQVMRRADGLHPDCYRDLRLAHQWGFANDKLSVVLPGNGGVDPGLFFPPNDQRKVRSQYGIPEDATVVINPRGFRSYVHNDVFFEAIRPVVAACPRVLFLGVGMEGDPLAAKWIAKLQIARYVRLLPKVQRTEMARLFQASDISVSLASHDGTPNTLLEAMACGCFPVAGDIESIGEWIVHGKNGLLCNPKSAKSVSSALVQAIEQSELRRQAKEVNTRLVLDRASYGPTMHRAEEFYLEVLDSVTRL